MRFIKQLTYFFMLVLILSTAGVAHAKENKYDMKYDGMDRNDNGTITRDEWQGNDRSFRNQDRNQDGVLTGNEVRGDVDRDDDYDRWNRNRKSSFSNLDDNQNNVISRNEWRGDRGDFVRLDCNQDSVLTRDEFIARTECNATASNDTFQNLDTNHDGYLYRKEWREGNQAFVNKDCNRDNKMSRVEYFTQDCVSGTCDINCLFRELDDDNDSRIDRAEWQGNSQTFNQLDQNRDDVLTSNEFSYLNNQNQNRQGTTQQVLGTVSDILNSIMK